MRITALAGLLACVVFTASSSAASAETLGPLQASEIEIAVSKPIIIASLNTTPIELEPAQPPAPQIVKYTVLQNDTLSTIAGKHNTTWKRLFDKNENIQNPDIIAIGDELVIPSADEVVKERALPEPVVAAAVVPAPVSRKAQRPTAPKAAPVQRPQARGSASGNLYTPGYCTWYVKNKRPDLPNNLGNANTWVSRARAQGLPTGSVPRAGAVGQRGMHVVYVESVNADGSVNISEMNHKGLYVITHRTLPGNYFQYIY